MRHRTTYRIDGLRVDTTIEVPGLAASSEAPDWHLDLRPGTLSETDPGLTWTGDVSDEEGPWALYGRRGDALRIHLRGILALEAERASGEASLDLAASGVTPARALRHALPYLAAIVGRTVLHASCVVLETGCVLCCGDARTGKSTLALALDGIGVPALADDHVAIDLDAPDAVVAHPSFPFADVDLASRRLLRPETAHLDGKRSVGFATTRPTGPVPVRSLCFLRRGDEVSRRALRAPEVAARLLRDVLFFGDPGSAAECEARLDAALALAQRVVVSEVTLPEGLSRMVVELTAVRRALEGESV